MAARGAWALAVAAAAAVVLIPTASPAPSAATDTITVAAGKTVLSKLKLEPGTTYYAVITGTIRLEYPANNAYELRDAYSPGPAGGRARWVVRPAIVNLSSALPSSRADFPRATTTTST